MSLASDPALVFDRSRDLSKLLLYQRGNIHILYPQTFYPLPLIRLPETARPPELPGALHHGRLGRRGVPRQQRRVRRHRGRSQRGGRRCRPQQRGGIWRRRPQHGFCKKLRAGFHLVPNHIPLAYACLPMQNEDIIQFNMYLLSVPVLTLFLGETSGLGRRGAKGDCGVAAAAF